MKHLYPIVRYAKTSLGYRLPEDRRGMRMCYCPICNKRLSGKKVDYNDCEVKRNNRVLKPVYCEKCGSLIHPLPRESEV